MKRGRDLQAALHKLDWGDRTLTVRCVRNSKARRYILRMQPGGIARVTIPRGGSLADALKFAAKNRPWIDRQLHKAPPAWGDGTVFLFRGLPVPLQVADGVARFAGHQCQDGGPGKDLRRCVEEKLRAIAESELKGRTLELASALQLTVRAVRVRNQHTRWGSCSKKGNINLNWRLIQTPDFVRDYIIVHELMHLHEMNHSDRFWAWVAAAFPAYLEAECWLRRNAGLLR